MCAVRVSAMSSFHQKSLRLSCHPSTEKMLNYLQIIIVFTEKCLLQASGKILQIIQDTQIIKINTTN